jgi:hypothetical protein
MTESSTQNQDFDVFFFDETTLNPESLKIENLVLHHLTSVTEVPQSDLLSALSNLSEFSSKYAKEQVTVVLKSFILWIIHEKPDSETFLNYLAIAIKTGEWVTDYRSQRREFYRDIMNLMTDVDDLQRLINHIDIYPLKLIENVIESCFKGKSAKLFHEFFGIFPMTIDSYEDRFNYLNKMVAKPQSLTFWIDDIATMKLRRYFRTSAFKDSVDRFSLVVSRLRQQSDKWTNELFLELIENLPDNFNNLLDGLELAYDFKVSKEEFMDLYNDSPRSIQSKIWFVYFETEKPKETYDYVIELKKLNPFEDTPVYGEIENVEPQYNGVRLYSGTFINHIAIKDLTRENFTDAALAFRNDISKYSNHQRLALVIRAMELFKGEEWEVRKIQVFTLILLYYSGKSRLAEVKTGEGKSMICAMLAALYANEGKRVDIGEFIDF